MPHYIFLILDITSILIHYCVCTLNTYRCFLLFCLYCNQVVLPNQNEKIWYSQIWWLFHSGPTWWSLDRVTLVTITGCDPDPRLQICFLSPQICLMMRSLGWIWLPSLGLPCSPHLTRYCVAGSWLTRTLLWWLCFCAWLLAPWRFRSCWSPLHPDNLILKRYPVFDFLFWFRIKAYYQLLGSYLGWESSQSPLSLYMKDSYLNSIWVVNTVAKNTL